MWRLRNWPFSECIYSRILVRQPSWKVDWYGNLIPPIWFLVSNSGVIFCWTWSCAIRSDDCQLPSKYKLSTLNAYCFQNKYEYISTCCIQFLVSRLLLLWTVLSLSVCVCVILICSVCDAFVKRNLTAATDYLILLRSLVVKVVFPILPISGYVLTCGEHGKWADICKLNYRYGISRSSSSSSSGGHHGCNDRVPTHPWKSLKVLEFFLLNSRPWKYLKTGEVLESPWISFHRSFKVLEFTKSINISNLVK